MKNFTNNFKQITSRLSARWLIMALMLLVGTSSLWGKTIYFKANGSNNWAADNAVIQISVGSNTSWKKMTSLGNGMYSYEANNGATVYFARGASEGSTWNVTGKLTVPSDKNLFTPNGWSNCTGDWSTYTPPTTYTGTIKFQRPSAWKNVPHIHMFYNGSNTLVDNKTMTLEGVDASGKTWYKYDYSITTTFTTATIMFNNGGWGNGQTNEQFKGNLGTDYCLTGGSSADVTSVDCPVFCTTVNAPVVTSNGPICAGSTATLTLTNRQEGVTYKLNSTTGTTIFTSGNNTYTTPALNANTTYKIYASHANACTNNVEGSVTVTVSPKPAITLKAAPTICQGTTITFANYVDNNNTIGTVTWHTKSDFSDAAITSAKPNATTTYYAKATSGNCTPATASLKVTVDSKPAITLNAAPTICPGDEVTFANYVKNTSIGTVTWHTKQDFSDAAITSATPNTTTTYYAKATSGVCDPATASLKVTVKPTPTKPTITLIPEDGKIVKGENATLTVTAQDDVTFTLYKDGASTGKTETSFTISEEGTYHVVGINSCKVSSPESDKKTITICTPNATLISATYNQLTDKIDLSGNLTETCGKSLYYGFLWKVKNDDWNTNNAISGTGGNNNYTSTNNTAFNQSWADAVMGTTYVFTAYALDASSGNPSTYVWYYDETGIEVSKCITITEPDITAAPICTGSTAVLTLNNRQEGVTYTLNDIPIFTDKDTYTTPPLADNADYTIIATSGSSCTPEQEVPATVTVQVEQIPAAPAITTKATICPNTDTPLSNFNNGVANVMWYSDPECNSPVTTANISSEKSYYARIKSGICFSEVAQLDLSVYIAPEQPSITPSGTIPVGQGKTATITVENYNANVTYTCYQGVNAVGTWNNNTLSITVGNALGETTYRIVASNPTCPNLTEETSFILDVKEAGAKIAILGSSALYTNDNTHFVPMYVQKEGITDVPGATKVTGFTWEYSANGSTNWAACSTGYQAAGPGMSNGGEKCNNWRANAVGYYRCKITYDVSYQYTNTLQVTSATNSNSNKQHVGATRNLPIISVNTGANAFPSDCNLNGDYPSKHADKIKAKISVDVKIFNKDGSLYYDRKARMNYRGSSSLNFKKKSYAFVTGKEKTKNEKGDVDTGKENLFGLSNGAKDKDWVLYAATPDPSMMRNRLAFDLYKEMTGKWGVSSMYVELVVNGEYKGVYVLMDKITNNEKRVNITSSNGFIVKFDKTDVVDRVENKEGDQKTFATTRTGTGVDGRHPNGINSYGTNIDQRFEIEYPEKEDIVDAGGNWTETYTIIKDRFEEFEAALAEKDYPTVRKLIDYDSWADWFIISEYIKNQDTYRASNIFVFNGDKIEAWPLWDQELSFNNQTRTAHGSTSTTGLMATTQTIYEDAFKAVFWLTGGDADDKGGLLGDPCFVALVKSKWEAYKANQLSASNVSTKVTAFGNELGKAQEREQARWPYSGDVRGLTCDGGTIGYYGKNEGQAVGYSTSVSAINTWATNRVNGFTNALNAYTTKDLIFGISPETTPATPWQPVILTVSVPEGFEYDIAYPELTAAGAIVTKTKDMYQVKIPRPTGDGWTIGGNGTDKNGQATAQTKTFTVTASITKSTENACGSVNKDKVTSTITLQDVTEACNPEIVKQQP